MKIAIVGFDTEGRASYDFLLSQGHDLTICDQNESLTLPSSAKAVLGDGYLTDLDQYDRIVRTAGMHPGKILEGNPRVADKITTHNNLFFEHAPTKNIIGVTGTKGKGTTSSLIAAMLTASGKDVQLGGNIGVPPLTFIDRLTAESWVVLELSSFQLIDLHYSPNVAVCLMVTPEHLDWHSDLDEYYTAKSQLFRYQTADDLAIYYADNDNSKRIASHGSGVKLPFMAYPGAEVKDRQIVIDEQVICSVDELKLLGEHNWQNACAAVTAVWQITPNASVLANVLTSFEGLEHRLEPVRELHGIRYYNDSFGTTPETAIVALQAFDAPKVIILGGSDKGADYNQLAQVVRDSNVRRVIAIGEQAERIKSALTDAGFSDVTDGGATMPEIVATATAAAEAGDVVLLSTACASFDMFKDYKDRGNQFKAAVQALQ